MQEKNFGSKFLLETISPFQGASYVNMMEYKEDTDYAYLDTLHVKLWEEVLEVIREDSCDYSAVFQIKETGEFFKFKYTSSNTFGAEQDSINGKALLVEFPRSKSTGESDGSY